MSLFVFDTAGDEDLLNVEEVEEEQQSTSFIGKGPLLPSPWADVDEDIGSEEEDDGDYGGLPPPSHDISHILKECLAQRKPIPKTKAEEEMELALEMVKQAEETREKNKPKNVRYRNRPNKDLVLEDFDMKTGKFTDSLCDTNVAEEMAKSNNHGLEQKQGLPQLPDKKLRHLRRIERGKDKGEGWFNMPATEVTEEVENDLKILQMRSVLNPKHFYKKNDLKVLPKFFQVGTVQHSPLDYYKERDKRRNKKKTLVDELLADAEFQKYTKRKFKEVTDRNDKYAHKKAMKKMKKLKKDK